MKVRCLVTALLCLSSVSYAQTVEDIGKIPLGVRFAEGSTAETFAMRTQLEDRLIAIASQSGYSSFGTSNFFISPNVVVGSTDVAEGGMKNVYVVRGDLYLVIKDDVNGTIYSSISFPFKGSATKQDTAIKNAIQNIDYSRAVPALQEAKTKILSYYETQKSVIFSRAETYAANGDYDAAITCLMMIPEDLTDIYSQALERAQEIYEKRDEAAKQQQREEQRNSNDAVLTEANSLLAMHDPKGALQTLWRYRRGDGEQDAQYASLVNKAEQQISASEMEALRKEERDYQDRQNREQRMWEEQTKDAEHRRQMDREQVELERQSIEIRRDAINAAERVASQQIMLEGQKVMALKAVACEYIRNNPNYGNSNQNNYL